MPATINPIRTERRKRPRLVGDTGSGGRPPVDRRHTGGGGDNDSDGEQHAHHSHGPRERINRYRMGLLFALTGDLMLFVALACISFFSHSSVHIDAYNRVINPWLPITVPSILWINTAVLLLSSLTVEAARRKMFREVDVMDEWLGLGKPAARRALPWLFATIMLGSLFIAGQFAAWKQLAAQHILYSSNPASGFFYLITWTHAIHLALGIVALLAAAGGLFLLRNLNTRQVLVDCAAWYWHSMGAYWIFLFAILVFFA